MENVKMFLFCKVLFFDIEFLNVEIFKSDL